MVTTTSEMDQTVKTSFAPPVLGQKKQEHHGYRQHGKGKGKGKGQKEKKESPAIPSAMVLNGYNYYNNHHKIVQTIARNITPASASSSSSSSLSNGTDSASNGSSDAIQVTTFNAMITPSMTITSSWVPTHRALPSVALATLSLNDLIKTLESVPMIPSLDDNGAIAYTVKHTKILQLIHREVTNTIGSYVPPPLVNMVMVYIPTYLQIGIGCEQRGDQPNAFRWFDAAARESLENDPPVIGAATRHDNQCELRR
jgi:hypothetical protein